MDVTGRGQPIHAANRDTAGVGLAIRLLRWHEQKEAERSGENVKPSFSSLPHFYTHANNFILRFYFGPWTLLRIACRGP